MNVLDDDVLGGSGEAETFALDDALISRSDDRLVATDHKVRRSRLVIGNSRRLHIATSAAQRSDVRLAALVWGASLLVAPRLSGRALGPLVVEGLIDENDTRSAIGKPSPEPIRVSGDPFAYVRETRILNYSFMSRGAAGVAEPPPVTPVAKPYGFPRTCA